MTEDKLNRIRWKLHDLAEELVGEDSWFILSSIKDGVLELTIDPREIDDEQNIS